MKLLILFTFCALQISVTLSKILPEYLPQPCSKSQPDYSECTTQFLRELGPYLLNGIDELNFPKLNPVIVPLTRMNRTVDDIVNYYGIFKNIHFWGLDTTHLKSFKFDTENMNGDLHMNIEYLRVSAEYEAGGRSLKFPYSITTVGYSKGNFTNLDVFFKFSLKKVRKQENKHYVFKDFTATGGIEDGFVEIISKYSEDQPIVDFLANFFNRNPKDTMNVLQDEYDECLRKYYKYLAEIVLNAVPAEELIPE